MKKVIGQIACGQPITAEETAKAVGISIKALSAYENGERIPRDEIKIKLAYHYGKSVESIFYAQLASAAGVM